MKYYKKLFILVSISLILCFITSLIYVSNIKFYGNILVITENTTTLVAKTPLNNSLNFEVATKDNKKIISYSHKRFYADIKLISKNKNDILNSKIYINEELQAISKDKIINSKGYYEYNIPPTNYSFSKKYVDFVSYTFTRFKTVFFIILLLIIFTMILLNSKTIFKKIKSNLQFKKYTNKTVYRYLISLTICLISLAFLQFINSSSKTNNQKIDNYVYLERGPDQFDYQTIAINYANNYEFLTTGELNKNIDYKIIDDKTQLDNKKGLLGVKALNRFPAYPFLVSVIYKIFGPNPIIIKLVQIFLLFLICFFLPLLAYRTWGLKGFTSGIIATPFIFHYLLDYTYLILPDTLSIIFNFFIIFLWLETRKKITKLNFIGLTLLLGISFLTKTSINIILPIIFIDIFINLKKQKVKNILFKLSYFLLIFFISWLPYNIYSIKKYYKFVDEATEIIQKIEAKSETELLKSFKTTENSDYFSTNLKDITYTDLKYFKENILPEINKNNYLPIYNTNINFNKNLLFLSYVKIISLNKKPYFMISLISNYGALECHNEYVTKGIITNEWLKHKDSFYNNDGLNSKSQLKRILNFYIKNPSQIFKISHSKLKTNIEHTNIIKIFTIVVLIFLIFTSLEKELKRKHKIFALILFFLGILLSLFIQESVSYIFIFLCLLLLMPSFKNYYFLPFIFLTLNGIAYSLIAYSSQRYLSYYMFILYFLTAFFLIEIFNILKSKKILTSYYKNKNKKIE